MPPRPVPNRRTPRCDGDALAPPPGEPAPAVPLDGPAWLAWLRDPAHPTFAYTGPAGAFTARRDTRGARAYWYAYRRQDGRLRKVYLGPAAAVTHARLEAAARALDRPAAPGGPGGGRATAAGRPRTNLPPALTSFVGRERELAAVGRLLATARLLTLTGAGGCGKTRLAAEVARRALPAYPGGVWLVELAPLADPDLVPQAVATALGVREQPGRPLVSTLAGALEPTRALLVLDNCEHLPDACAALAEALLRACPALTILATSRALLGAAGEAAWRVPSLAVPDPAGPACAPALAEVEAVRLFVERARLVRPDFALTERNAAAVARVCARLDGLPLALELAAARLRLLAVEQVAARLDDRLRLLGGGDRTAPPRHRALRATLDWSHDLLDEEERVAFRRLSVFAGGWTLEAAEAVVGDAGLVSEALDLLGRLVERSLVQVEECDGAVRYQLLETVRQYAAEKLRASGEEAALRARHAAASLALVEAGDADFGRPDWRARLERERENWRSALAWAIEAGDRTCALRLTIALYEFWILRGDLAEGRAWLERALALLPAAARTEERAVLLGRLGLAAHFAGDDAAARAHLAEAAAIVRGLGASGHLAQVLVDLALAHRRTDPAAARRLLEEALAVARRVAGRADAPPLLPHLGLPPALAARWSGGRAQVALCRHHLGQLAAGRGDLAGACVHLEAAAALRRELGDGPAAASSLKELAIVRARGGDATGARALLEQSLAAARAAGWRAVAGDALRELGELALGRGDAAAARAALAEAVAITHALGDPLRLALALESGAGLALALAQAGRAAHLLGAAAAQRAASGVPALPAEAARAAGRLGAARAALGATAFAAARAAGSAMTADEAVAAALAVGPPGSSGAETPAPDGLSRREVEVLRLLARGASNAAIAAALSVSVRTVHGHVASILGKTGRPNRTAAAAFARDHGLA